VAMPSETLVPESACIARHAVPGQVEAAGGHREGGPEARAEASRGHAFGQLRARLRAAVRALKLVQAVLRDDGLHGRQLGDLVAQRRRVGAFERLAAAPARGGHHVHRRRGEFGLRHQRTHCARVARLAALLAAAALALARARLPRRVRRRWPRRRVRRPLRQAGFKLGDLRFEPRKPHVALGAAGTGRGRRLHARITAARTATTSSTISRGVNGYPIWNRNHPPQNDSWE
jgi:hypothetical protein